MGMKEPMETSELLAFARTVDARSLSRAAAELGIPRATISRRLARLEERLGTRLLRRTTRSLVLTDAGQAFYRHARIVLDAVDTAEASVRRPDDAIRGDLRVSVPPMLDEEFFTLVEDFARRHPALRVHMHFSTGLVDLQKGGFDVAIRAASVVEPGLVARTIQRQKVVLVASPAYLEEKGTPRTRRDLRDHRCLMAFGAHDLPQTHWPVAGGGTIHVQGWLFSNEIRLLLHAALRGLGIALLPHGFVGELLERGLLVHVLPGLIEAEARVMIAWAERELVPPQVRAFVDAIMPWATREMVKPPPNRCPPEKEEPKAKPKRRAPRR
jgi:DNA-binding transcriptional LysR family regulator